MALKLRLQAWATNRRGTYYSLNLNGVPLGDRRCKDFALSNVIKLHLAELIHHTADEGAMMFTEAHKASAKRIAILVLKDYEFSKVKTEETGVYFDGKEMDALLKLVDYLMRSDVGSHQKTLLMIRSKVQGVR